MRAGVAFLAVLASVAFAGCGYRIAGRADTIPVKVKTIAIPPFGNATTRYKLTDQLAGAIAREFIGRTRYRIVADQNEADAVLTGSIANLTTSPTIFDPATGRASGVQVNVFIQLTLKEKATGAVLYHQPNMEFRQRYEISLDQAAFFNESDAGLQRLSRDVARSVVTAILENF